MRALDLFDAVAVAACAYINEVGRRGSNPIYARFAEIRLTIATTALLELQRLTEDAACCWMHF
jgi:hypothetical protein